MKTTRFCSLLYPVLGLLFLSIHGQANAQPMVDRIQILAQRADAIVIGKVTKVRSEWDAGKTRIVTKVSLDVDEYVKGQPAGKTIVVTHLGGEVDGVGELYSSAPLFSKGEDVVVFVKKDSKNNLNVAGGIEGKMKVTGNEATKERMVQGNLSLTSFTSMVKSAINQKVD